MDSLIDIFKKKLKEVDFGFFALSFLIFSIGLNVFIHAFKVPFCN